MKLFLKNLILFLAFFSPELLATTPINSTGLVINASTPLSTPNVNNAATVTNGIYSTGSYSDPAWIISLAGSKITGSVSPGGSAGGDLTGTYPNPTVIANGISYSKFQQIVAASLFGNPTGILANGQAISLGATLNFVGTALQTLAFSGDITTPANSFVTTLATVNSNIGSFGDATHTVTETVNGKGLITAVSSNLITPAGIGAPQTNGTGATGTWPVSISGNSATVTTNANLTGVITSIGNATSIVSQTGTGTKFVVDTSPTLITPNIGAATGTALNLSGLTASSLVVTDGSKNLSSTNTLSATVLGNITKPTTTTFTSGSGTYSSPANCTHVQVEIWGGGGGGGGVAGAASSAGGASGGGGGGYSKSILSCPLSVAYSVGAAGSGGSLGANAGLDGGDTTFSTMTASGGGGGAATTAAGSAAILQSGSGGAASGGDINIVGGGGGQGTTLSSTLCTGGFGGASARGGPGIKSPLNGNGLGGIGPGGGGSGAATIGLNSRSGGNGAAGRAIIIEYYNG